jgi:hypothetical protein
MVDKTSTPDDTPETVIEKDVYVGSLRYKDNTKDPD